MKKELEKSIGLPLNNSLKVLDTIEVDYDFRYDPKAPMGYLTERGLYQMSANERIHRVLNGHEVFPDFPKAVTVDIEHAQDSTNYILRFYAEPK